MPAGSASRLIAGCGYLGFRVAESWSAQSESTFAVTRSEARATRFRAAGLVPIFLNLGSPDDNAQLPVVDVVLWSVGYDHTVGTPRQAVWLNGLQWLVEHLPAAPRRILYVSSTGVYGGNNGQIVNEATAVNPSSEGGKCCVAAEQLLRDTCQEKFPQTQVVVLRMAGIYGPDRLLRRVADLRNKSPLPGEPDDWLNLIHVDDAVRMVKFVARAPVVPDLINVVSTNTVTRRQYYSQLAELVSAPPPVFFGAASSTTTRARGGNKRVVSVHRDELSVNFEFDDIADGLADAVRRTGGATGL